MTAPAGRAPRLGSRQYLAPYLTRRGRFARIDPLKDRARPSWPRLVAILGWGLLMEESIRRATRAHRADEGS